MYSGFPHSPGDDTARRTRNSSRSQPSWLCALALSLVAPLACAPTEGGDGAAQVPRPRNVILISIDTLRADGLGCYGSGRETSPAIDRLAQQGVLFEDVTSAAPWTLPAHASMLTGLYPSHHGVKDHVDALNAATLATLLAADGLHAMAIVNSRNLGDPRFGLLRGFDPQRTHYFPESVVPSGGGMSIPGCGKRITDLALQWLAERDARPFFLFLHYYDVHSSYTPSAEYRAKFVAPYDGPLSGMTKELVTLRSEGQRLSSNDMRFLRDLYDAEIRTLDDQLARLFAYLDSSGLERDTLVVLTSDHGEEFGEHGGVMHGRTQYQELLAIPLILRGPGVPIGLRVERPVHLVDLAPTVLASLGSAAAARAGLTSFDGIDLRAAWNDEQRFGRQRLLFAEADHNNVVDGKPVVDVKCMVRVDDTKLCVDRVTQTPELYDLAADPGEHDDLAHAHPERVSRLQTALELFLAGQRSADHIDPPTAEELEQLRALGYTTE